MRRTQIGDSPRRSTDAEQQLMTLEKVQLLRYGAAHCAGEAPEARSDVGG